MGNHKNRFPWLNQRDWFFPVKFVYPFCHDASEILPVRDPCDWRKSMNVAKFRPFENSFICMVRWVKIWWLFSAPVVVVFVPFNKTDDWNLFFVFFPAEIAAVSKSQISQLDTQWLATFPRECFHSRGQHLCKFVGTKEILYIRKEFNSLRTGLGHKHGRRFIVLGHKYGRHAVMWKHNFIYNLRSYFASNRCQFSRNHAINLG